MSSTDTTNSNRGLKLNDWVELISNAAVPLMIGVISLWIALHQQNITQTNYEQDTEHANQLRQQDLQIARLQRDEDKEIARLQRLEDQEIIRLQREEDRTIARLRREKDHETAQRQREEDRKTAQLQREEDREIAHLQRELDLNITATKRIQDYQLAEQERNLSEIQRTKEFEINYQNRIQDLIFEDNRQKENVLIEYQDDLAMLLLDYNLMKTVPSSDAWFILQMKTEAALRQLDSARRTILVHSLVEANIFDKFVEDHESVFLNVNLTGVEFGESLHLYKGDVCILYGYLNIRESDVRYASFHGVCLNEITSFSYSNFDHTDWSYATIFNSIYFYEISMNYAKFFGSTFIGTKFTEQIQMNQASFQYNSLCTHCQFIKTKLTAARFDHSNFLQSSFYATSLADVNMTNGSFRQTTFEKLMFDRVILSGADLTACRFFHVSMINCSLFQTNFHQVTLEIVNMTGCQVFISIHQQNLAQSNRNKDLTLAIQQRQENLEQARLQREEDKNLAQIQRNEDKNMSQIQRNEDKELARIERDEDGKMADLQRENDKELARLRREEDGEMAYLQRQADYQMSVDKRSQESELAHKQRQLYESQRQHEFDILQQNYLNDFQLKIDQQKEQILINYQRQLTKLVLDYDIMGHLHNSSLRFVLQMRTRTALRLLDSQRRTILIQTLYRGTLLDATWKDRKALLYRTNLTGVQFGRSSDRNFSRYFFFYDYLDIQHADVRHATFYLVNFEEPPVFKYSNFDHTDWSLSELVSVLFGNQITLNHARFYRSYCKQVNFSHISMNYVSFETNDGCQSCLFNGISMLNAYLYNSTFDSTEFHSILMTNANLSYGSFYQVIFRNVILDFADFSHATFERSRFENVSMLNCSMLNVRWINTEFVNVNDKNCKYDKNY